MREVRSRPVSGREETHLLVRFLSVVETQVVVQGIGTVERFAARIAGVLLLAGVAGLVQPQVSPSKERFVAELQTMPNHFQIQNPFRTLKITSHAYFLSS